MIELLIGFVLGLTVYHVSIVMTRWADERRKRATFAESPKSALRLYQDMKESRGP